MARWNIDPVHSSAQFSVRHMMVNKVRGVFSNLTGWLEFAEDTPESAQIEATIDVSSIDTRTNDRDNHLRSPDFFDVENYPQMVFKSTSVKKTGENTGQVTGDLTIKDVTREVTFDIEYYGQADSPFGDVRAGFSGTSKINREDFGLTWNQALESGGVLVGKEVQITIELQVVQEQQAPATV
ncbi:MAG: YceI family protein [Chloroflexi bacterium]|nr:YceI family protein [Chloroflexota bacterium]